MDSLPGRMRALFAGAVVLIAACSSSEEHGGAPPTRPNIILVMADDLGWGQMSARRHPYLRTPNLDAMARDGVSLERFYAAAPVCSPTRASVLTGRHPNRMRCFAWGHVMPPGESTIAECLRDAGYATVHIGKWHLGSVRGGEPTSPGGQGFDEWWSAPNFFDLDPQLSHRGEVVQTAGESSQVLTDLAIQFLEHRAPDAPPFLLVVWLASPHDPHRADQTDLTSLEHVPADARAYAAEIEAIDQSLGRIRHALDDLGLARDTLLWFTSDNGPRAPRGTDLGTAGLRGEKRTLWEGGIRVPSLVVWPGTLVPGTRIDGPTGTVDILPTVLSVAGAATSAGSLDGQDLLPAFLGDSWRRQAPLGFWTYPSPGRAMHSDRILSAMARGERHRDETPPNPDLAPLERGEFPGEAAWIDGDWKLVVMPTPDGPIRSHLYNLADDPREAVDLAPSHPDRTERMTERLRSWQRDVSRDCLSR